MAAGHLRAAPLGGKLPWGHGRARGTPLSSTRPDPAVDSLPHCSPQPLPMWSPQEWGFFPSGRRGVRLRL